MFSWSKYIFFPHGLLLFLLSFNFFVQYLRLMYNTCLALYQLPPNQYQNNTNQYKLQTKTNNYTPFWAHLDSCDELLHYKLLNKNKKDSTNQVAKTVDKNSGFPLYMFTTRYKILPSGRVQEVPLHIMCHLTDFDQVQQFTNLRGQGDQIYKSNPPSV